MSRARDALNTTVRSVRFAPANIQLRRAQLVLIMVVLVPTLLSLVVGILLTAPRLVPAGTWRMARGLPSVMLARALLAGAFYAGIKAGF